MGKNWRERKINLYQKIWRLRRAQAEETKNKRRVK